MRLSALSWLCGLLAFALAKGQTLVVEEVVNDVIKPNDGLFSDAVEQFGIVSFSPTPSATTSETPTTSPPASEPSSISALPSPLASASALPFADPSPSPLVSASPPTLISPVPSTEDRRPSSPDAREPVAPVIPSMTPSSSSSVSMTPSSSPTPSPLCQIGFSKTGTVGSGGGGGFDDTSALSATEILTEIAIADGIDGVKFTTSDQVLAQGKFGANDRILTVPTGETVQIATACVGNRGLLAITYLRFELSNGDSVESGTQPANGCETFTAPPGTEIIGKFGGKGLFLDRIGFVLRC